MNIVLCSLAIDEDRLTHSKRKSHICEIFYFFFELILSTICTNYRQLGLTPAPPFAREPSRNEYEMLAYLTLFLQSTYDYVTIMDWASYSFPDTAKI